LKNFDVDIMAQMQILMTFRKTKFVSQRSWD